MLPGIQEEPVASNLKVRTFTNNNNTNLCDLDNWIILDVSKNNYFRCQWIFWLLHCFFYDLPRLL